MSRVPRRSSPRITQSVATPAKVSDFPMPPTACGQLTGTGDLVSDLGQGDQSALTAEQIAYRRGRRYREVLLASGRQVVRGSNRTTLRKAVLLLPSPRATAAPVLQ